MSSRHPALLSGRRTPVPCPSLPEPSGLIRMRIVPIRRNGSRPSSSWRWKNSPPRQASLPGARAHLSRYAWIRKGLSCTWKKRRPSCGWHIKKQPPYPCRYGELYNSWRRYSPVSRDCPCQAICGLPGLSLLSSPSRCRSSIFPATSSLKASRLLKMSIAANMDALIERGSASSRPAIAKAVP